MPMGEYYNLFLGVATAVSLFLVVQHVGHVVIRYFSRCSSSSLRINTGNLTTPEGNIGNRGRGENGEETPLEMFYPVAHLLLVVFFRDPKAYRALFGGRGIAHFLAHPTIRSAGDHTMFRELGFGRCHSDEDQGDTGHPTKRAAQGKASRILRCPLICSHTSKVTRPRSAVMHAVRAPEN